MLSSDKSAIVSRILWDDEFAVVWALLKTGLALLFILFGLRGDSPRLVAGVSVWVVSSFSIDTSIGTFRNTGFSMFLVNICLGLGIGLGTPLLFRFMKIRGKILTVCLIAGGLPMYMFGIALSQQYQFIERHTLPTVAREALQQEVGRLNHALSERMRQDLAKLIGLDPRELKTLHYSFEIASPSSYWDRAARLRVPLLEVHVESFLQTLNLDLRDVPMQAALQMITRAHKLNLVIEGKLPPHQQVSITGRNLSLDDMLAQISAVSPITTKRVGNQLIVNANASDPTTESSVEGKKTTFHRAISINSKRQNELQDLCVKVPGAKAQLRIDSEGEHQSMTITLLQREASSGELQGVTRLTIDYGGWLKHLLQEYPYPTASGAFCLHSTNYSALKPLFPDYRVVLPDERKPLSTGKLFEQRELLLYQSFADTMRDGHSLLEFENADFSPSPALIGGTPDLRLVGTDGREWLLQGWSVPRAMTTVTFVVPVCILRDYLLEKQRQPLILAMVAILMALWLSYAYSRSMSTPLQAITEAARRIRDGDLDVQIPAPGGRDEIHELSEALGVMAERLKGRIVSANQRVLEEKTKFETLLESTWEGIYLLTPDGNLAYANQAGRQLLGETAVGKPLTELLTGLGQEFQPPLPATFAGIGGDFRTHFQLPDPDGGKRKILALYLRLLPESLGMLAVCRDITIEKEIDRMKSEFVSQVSHELRTPLTSIQAYTEMLLDGEAEDSVQQKDYLGIILDESQRLTRLINDLLDIARIESGKRVIKPVKLDLAALSREIVLILGGQAERRKLAVEVRVPSDSLWFTGDPDLIKQIGLNLLSNALKYTPEGGRVTISAEPRPGAQVAWSFIDSGIGMTPQERDRLFTKFFRADSEYVKNAGGTGLGLTLVKQIVDRHGGEIHVDSEFGKGSTFTILLPGQLAL